VAFGAIYFLIFLTLEKLASDQGDENENKADCDDVKWGAAG
jgi:hypothetical protein